MRIFLYIISDAPCRPEPPAGANTDEVCNVSMKGLRIALAMLMLAAFGTNAYAAASAALCDCAGMAQPEAMQTDMQCHDPAESDPAWGHEMPHGSDGPCASCALGYCDAPTPASMFDTQSAAGLDPGALPPMRASTRKPHPSYGISHPPQAHLL